MTQDKYDPRAFVYAPWGTHKQPKNERWLDVQIRWLIRRDFPEVLDIEQASFEYPWSEENFLCCLRQRNCIGMVAQHNHHIHGFMVYELHKAKLHILNYAVAPNSRRQGVGTQMTHRLIDKLAQQGREEIVLQVRERNIDAQRFFKTMGFRAISVLRQHYDDTNEDAYSMQFRMQPQGEENTTLYYPHNRITNYGTA